MRQASRQSCMQLCRLSQNLPSLCLLATRVRVPDLHCVKYSMRLPVWLMLPPLHQVSVFTVCTDLYISFVCTKCWVIGSIMSVLRMSYISTCAQPCWLGKTYPISLCSVNTTSVKVPMWCAHTSTYSDMFYTYVSV